MDIETLFSAVQSRTDSYGIGTAAPFLRQFERCLGGMCPSKCFESVSEARWRQAVNAAQRQLVYHHPEMGVAGEFENAARGAELPPHTIASFPAVITTTRQDRDGDILETRGAELDPKAPLLYQHMPFKNVGRLLKQGERTGTALSGVFSLCGTALGEDCAMLAEHGALRISHGFMAEEFEPLDEKEYEIPGFRVLKFKILEWVELACRRFGLPLQHTYQGPQGLSRAQYCELMKACRCYVMAGFEESNATIPALEAALCGKPVLLSDLPACREEFGDTATYFKPWDFGDLLAKLAEVAHGRHPPVAEARERVLRLFDIAHVAKRIAIRLEQLEKTL